MGMVPQVPHTTHPHETERGLLFGNVSLSWKFIFNYLNNQLINCLKVAFTKEESNFCQFTLDEINVP